MAADVTRKCLVPICLYRDIELEERDFTLEDFKNQLINRFEGVFQLIPDETTLASEGCGSWETGQLNASPGELCDLVLPIRGALVRRRCKLVLAALTASCEHPARQGDPWIGMA